jgi:hypothetical protein
MNGKNWRVGAVAILAVIVTLSAVGAEGDKPIDGGKAEKFKGKTFELKVNGKAKIALAFPADKTAQLTVRSKKESDINLFVYDSEGKEVAKDDSPGPSCDIKFTPTRAGKYTLEILNKGPVANSSTLKVTFGGK